MEKKLIEWNDSLSVKVEEIDAQHLVLVDMINNLYSAFTKGQAKMILKEIVGEMITYAANHFSTEEKYFEKFDYVLIDEHIAEHQKFAETVIKFQKDFEEDKATVSYEVMNFLKDWLIQHIKGSDQKYVDCFISNGLK